MLDEHPYLARQLLVFYRHAHRGIPRGGEFVGKVLPRSRT
jgi:pyrimidine operon attenuation protein/uracil phosphoribosyltransferase